MEYVRLGNSGLKVSKVILGCMTFGSSKWEGSPWTLDEEEGLKLLKKAYDCGINTWDTADTYSNGKSEEIIGKALKKYNIPRSRVVILSKIYNPVMDDDSRPASVNDGALVNQMGLSRKHVFAAVDATLARLGTDYVDVLQIHRLDRETPPEEVMRALHDVVAAGKARYIGASSMWAWEFARLQHVAELRGWTKFVSMQPFYNLLYREEEREMIPFCEATGVAVIPWSPLARGLLAKPAGKGGQSLRGQADKKGKAWNETANMEIVGRVEELAGKKGVSMASVATAWVLQKGCCPIVGLSTVERVEEIVGVLKVKLTDEEMRYLEEEYKPRNVEGM
ncbi:putative aryl-alcohol dehydrogenase protein [Neofusicoccum parvum]|uniref:Aryl-alcohol dehydrogenase protein n=1 Tax=Neofusicoccum parvum TaxID=310453 RepID=A0ACB5SMF0_9PEZI|nr:putative aryl-alcohol dehydrogenase protein [Neofusicoccum parvum]